MRSVGFLMVLALAVGCGSGDEGPRADDGGPGQTQEDATAAYQDLSVAQLQEMMAEGDFFFVNVHVPFEGDIPGTDASIRFDEVSEHLDQFPEDRDAPIVLYCRSDRMSREAAETLTSLGFSNVYNVVGGFRAWEAAGLELEMGSGGP
jgi:rhodanese-related sulfurtransferase